MQTVVVAVSLRAAQSTPCRSPGPYIRGLRIEIEDDHAVCCTPVLILHSNLNDLQKRHFGCTGRETEMSFMGRHSQSCRAPTELSVLAFNDSNEVYY
jgi:hypothetical protein